MNKRKLVSCGIVLSVALALLIATWHFYRTRGVYVSVNNNTQSTLKNMVITYTGGVIQIVALDPKMSYGKYIKPSHPGELTLEWSDSMGAKHSHMIGVYIEQGYAGSVEITVEPDNRVSVRDNVGLWPLLLLRDWVYGYY
ncbi:MAG: hypothetical protein ACYST5_05815 [Planctomycetota bacterium]|jgi:hypothetical protein